MSKTFIIAEAGSNHQRDWQIVKQLILSATTAKCDVIKFQSFTSETMYSKYTPNFAGHINIPRLIKGIELPKSWYKLIKEMCDDIGIEFMSTPFDEWSIEELVKIGVKRLKIAGFEATDTRFVKLAASTKLPLIISVGIGSDSVVRKQIIHDITDVNPDVDLTLLHCNNGYPTPINDINLKTMEQIRNQVEQIRLGEIDYRMNEIKVGLSDHTEGILIPPVAVALGAQCIEKHITIDRTLSGPDHKFAIEPHELICMVRNIRQVEKSLGIKKDCITDSEQQEKLAMRAVYAHRDIQKGEIFGSGNITTKRPLVDGAIPAKYFYDILGKKCLYDVAADKPITHAHF